MKGQTPHPLPKFGLLTDPLEPVLPQIIRFHKLGFDYVEIGIEEPRATPRAFTQALSERVDYSCTMKDTQLLIRLRVAPLPSADKRDYYNHSEEKQNSTVEAEEGLWENPE